MTGFRFWIQEARQAPAAAAVPAPARQTFVLDPRAKFSRCRNARFPSLGNHYTYFGISKAENKA